MLHQELQGLQRITSKDNPHIKHAGKLLASKKYRLQNKLFLAEGVRLCSDAVKSGLVPEQVFLTEKLLNQGLDAILMCAKEIYLIPEHLAGKISDTQNPQGVFCIFPMREHNFQIKNAEKAKYVLLSSLQDPGNIGTIIRTCEAFGVDTLILSSDCPDVYSPKILRSAMGGVFRLDIQVTNDIGKSIQDLKDRNIPVYAAALHKDSRLITEVSFQDSVAVVIGNEGNGLSDQVIDACSSSIVIPMNGNAESLNAAVAASVLIWEMSRGNAGRSALS